MDIVGRIASATVRAVWRVIYTYIVPRYLDGVVGVANIPESGPFILVSNHTSGGDALSLLPVLYAVRNDKPALLAKAEGFKNWHKFFYRAIGGMPIDRTRPGEETKASIERVLVEGRPLVIFPEGTRNTRKQHMLPFLDTPFAFAVRAGVPVIPAAVLGASKIVPKGTILPRLNRPDRVRVAFGRTLLPDPARPRRTRIVGLRAGSRIAIRELLEDLRQARWEQGEEAWTLTNRAVALLNTAIGRPDRKLRRSARRRATMLLRLARSNDPAAMNRQLVRAAIRMIRALTGPPFISAAVVRWNWRAGRILRKATSDGSGRQLARSPLRQLAHPQGSENPPAAIAASGNPGSAFNRYR